MIWYNFLGKSHFKNTVKRIKGTSLFSELCGIFLKIEIIRFLERLSCLEPISTVVPPSAVSPSQLSHRLVLHSSNCPVAHIQFTRDSSCFDKNLVFLNSFTINAMWFLPSSIPSNLLLAKQYYGYESTVRSIKFSTIHVIISRYDFFNNEKNIFQSKYFSIFIVCFLQNQRYLLSSFARLFSS